MGEEKKELKIRDLVEISGFKSWVEVSNFLHDLGGGVEQVEKIVTDVGLGTRLILRGVEAAIGAFDESVIDSEIERHRKKIEELEAAKKIRKL